jgi:hypothetical protein
MGGACSTYGEEELHRGFWWGNLWKREHLEDSGGDWMIITKWIFRKWVSMDFIDLAQEE